jgi:hypothetical protein
MSTWKKLCRTLGILVLAVLINAAVIGMVLVKMPPWAGESPATRPNRPLASRPQGIPGEGTGTLVRPGAGTPRREPARTPSSRKVPGEPAREVVAKERATPEREETGDRRLAADPAAADQVVASPSTTDQDPEHSPPAAAGPGPMPRDWRSEALVEYNARKAQAGDNADAQQRLALWCDSHGLWDEAKLHWEAVVRLSPRPEVARRRLGYRLLRDGRWTADAALAEAATQQKADEYWGRELAADHKRIDTKRPKPRIPTAVFWGVGANSVSTSKRANAAAARSQDEAVTRVEAVRDPRAVPALWRVFAGHHSHHGLVVAVLSRIESPQGSRMLAALAVYSLDAKARAAATRALAGRDPAEFRDKLVGLMNAPLRAQVREVPDAAGRPMRVLFIEDEKANYQFLYPAPPTPDAFCGGGTGYLPGISTPAMARQFNQEQAQMARVLSDRQVESDLAAVAALNQQIQELNQRVAQVLNRTCGVHFGPEPESWRRWLAQLQGTTYEPPDARSKPTLAQVVAPLFSPTFLPVPAPT